MTNILVTPEQLQATSAQLNSGAAEIEAINSQLRSQVAPLATEWRGQAQMQFQALWEEWARSAQGIQHALHGIAQLTGAAANNYADTEQAIAQSFTR